MASQVTLTPPSSSPTRSDPVQPKTAAPVVTRQQSGWPGSSEPPPKRRRRAPSVVGEEHNAAAYSAHPPPVRRYIRQPRVNFARVYPRPSDPIPARPHMRRPLDDFTSLYRRASNPAKALAKKAAASEPKESTAIAHFQPPGVASTSFHSSTQGGWTPGPAMTPAPGGGQNWSWEPPLPNTAAPLPLQPAWNTPAPSFAHGQEIQRWTEYWKGIVQQNYPGVQPVFNPQDQSWSWHQSYVCDMSTPTPSFVGHASQVHHAPVTGTADRPILLDDVPFQPGHLPTASIQGQNHQGLGASMHSQANPGVEDKENKFSYLEDIGFHVTYDPKTGLPNGAARGFSTPAPAVQAQDKKSKPGKESQPRPARDEPNLCPEQAELVSLIEEGHNVFYTGSAGCGKSTVLKAFVRRLRDSGKKVRIIAPTGRAALNVGGSTTWTFAGWTPSSHKLPIERIKQGAHGKNVYKRLKETDVLVIDEISMVENLHLERLNILMKTARHNPSLPVQPAFGGCQIVVTGDFCQLPPVKPFQHCLQCGREMTTKVNDIGKLSHACRLHGEYADEDKWAFRSNAWRECNFVHFHLKTIHRQNDQKFIRMLQKCRLGHQMSESEISLLMDHKCRVSQATKLYSTRKEASDVNRAAFNQLKGVKYAYWCHDNFFWRECHPHLQRKGVRGEWNSESEIASPPDTKRPLYALEDHRWAKCVELKRGMLVVLLTNLDLEAGLCNGSQGVICSFEDYNPKMLPMKDTSDSRGRKKVEPQPGQRVLRGEHAAVQESEIKTFILSESAPVKKWPVVRFHNGIRRTVYAECSISQLGDEEPYSLLARTQIPLAPAWAMTIHKSQSLTLDRVIVNLSKAFEDGQVYVALSRATGLNGLKIEGDGDFLRNKMMVNSEVAAFLKEKFGDIYGATDSDDEHAVSE